MEKKKKVVSLASGSEQSGNESNSRSGGKKAKLSLQRKESSKNALVPAVDLNETEDFKDCRSYSKKPAVKAASSRTEGKEVLKRKERNKRVREGTRSETDSKDSNEASRKSESKKERQVKVADDAVKDTKKNDVGFKTIKGHHYEEDCADGKIYVRRTYGKGEPGRLADDQIEQGPGKSNEEDLSNFGLNVYCGEALTKHETKGKGTEKSKPGKSLTSRFGRPEKQKLQHGCSAMSIDQAHQLTAKDDYDFSKEGKITTEEEEMIERPRKIRQCPTCQVNLPREIFVDHLKDCLANFEKKVEEKRKKVRRETELKERQRRKQEEESAFGISLSEGHIEDSHYLCQICQTDLSPLDAVGRAEHVNSCIDKVEPKKTSPAQPSARSGVPDCPMCGKPLKTEASRTVHLKKCARTLGVTTDQMMTAVKAQEKEVHTGAGSVTQRPVEAKKAATARRKKTKLPTDEATQLAMALSSSLADEERKRERALIGQLNLRGIGEGDKLSATDGKKSRKKKGTAGAPPLLLQLTKEESHSRVAQRVTLYIESQTQDTEIPATPRLSRESCLDDLPGTKMVDYTAVKEKYGDELWGLTSLEGHAHPRSVYYTQALMPPICMSRVPPGSKLRRLSQIPGRRKSEEEHPTSDMEEENPATPIIASTPTALVLAELAGEGDAQLQQDKAHSQGDTHSHVNTNSQGDAHFQEDNTDSHAASMSSVLEGDTHIQSGDAHIQQGNAHSQKADANIDTDRSKINKELRKNNVSISGNNESLDDEQGVVNIETGDDDEDDDVLEQASGFCVEQVFEVNDEHSSSRRLLLIQKDYLSLVDNPSLSDVTIETCDKCHIHAHQVIFMLRCPALLKLTEAGVISLPGNSREAVLSLFKFVYAGTVEVPHSSLTEVLALAQRFGVEELARHCESALEKINTDADPPLESMEHAERERRESLDDMFKELLSGEDSNMVPEEDVEKDFKENQSDDDEDDWREIFLSQRQQLQRSKSLEEEQKTSAEKGETSDQDMEVDEDVLSREVDISEDAPDFVEGGRNSKQPGEALDVSCERKEEIQRTTSGTRGTRHANKNHKQPSGPSRNKDGPGNEDDWNKKMASRSRNRDKNHRPSKRKNGQKDRKGNSKEMEEDEFYVGKMTSKSMTNDPIHKKMKNEIRPSSFEESEENRESDVGRMTCGEEELFPSEDELMSQDLHLALDSSEAEEVQESDNVSESFSHRSVANPGSDAESSLSGSSKSGRQIYETESIVGQGKNESSSKSRYFKGSSAAKSDSQQLQVDEANSDSDSGVKRQSDDFVIIKSGTSTSDGSCSDESDHEGSKDLLPSPEEINKNQGSSEISEADVIDSSLQKTSEPTKRKRTASEADVINSPVFRKSSTSFETPREKCSRKRVKLGTPSTEQTRNNTTESNKMSTPVDRSLTATSRSSVVTEDSLYITPIPKERQRSTFMFATPEGLTENSFPSGAGDFVAIPVGRIILTDEGQEGILPLQEDEMGGSIKFSSKPPDKSIGKEETRDRGIESERLGDNPTSSDGMDNRKRRKEGRTLSQRRVEATQSYPESDDENRRNRVGESISMSDRPASDERFSDKGDGYGDIRKKLLAQVRGQIAVLQSEEETSDRGEMRKERSPDESDDGGDVSPVIPVTRVSESVSRPGPQSSDSPRRVVPADIGDSGEKETSPRGQSKPSGCQTDSDSDVEITSDNLQLVAELSNSISPKFKSISCLKKVSSERSSRRLSLNTSRSSSHSADADVDADVEVDAADDGKGESPTCQGSPMAPGDVWEGFDDIDAGHMFEPFCDADTEESPRKRGLEILGSAQKKRFTHRRRISLEESTTRSSVGHVATPTRSSVGHKATPEGKLLQETDHVEEDSLPSPENFDQGEVTVEFEVPDGDSILWHEENVPEEETGTGEQEEREQTSWTSKFKTPVSRQPAKQSKKWVPPSPFTPMPNYDAMNTPQLKKAVTKYGVRPVGKKRMKILLKDIYQQTHQYETDSDYDQDSPHKQLPPNNKSVPAKQKSSKSSPKSTLVATKTSSKPAGKSSKSTSPSAKSLKQAAKSSVQTSKTSTQTSKTSKTSHLTSKTSKTAVPFAKPSISSAQVPTRILSADGSDTSASGDGSSNRTVSSSQDSGPSDVPEESFLHDEEEEEDEDDMSASQKGNQADFHAKMLQFVRKRPDIHTRMMMYEPLELDWLKKEVQDSGVKCSTQKLMDFLDEKCLTFTMKNMTKRNANRRKPKKRRKIDVPEAAV